MCLRERGRGKRGNHDWNLLHDGKSGREFPRGSGVGKASEVGGRKEEARLFRSGENLGMGRGGAGDGGQFTGDGVGDGECTG